MWQAPPVTSSIEAPDPVRYLDGAAASATGRAYKRRLLAALGLRPGLTVLDIGCGPGTDLPAMAGGVAGGTGLVIGLDVDATMRTVAHNRGVGLDRVRVAGGDAHALPLRDASVDRVRFDRVLQHLAEPARALAEAHRVLRPGGVLGLAEPDWYTLVVDDPDRSTSDAFARFVAAKVRHGAIGRQLARLAAGAGFVVGTVDATAVVYRDPVEAEQILGLRRNLARAVAAGAVDEAAGARWLARVNAGPTLASFTFYTVTASA
jgi:ubiquinone/menaquinone biosynthesis C-methylase UbiE